MADPAPRGCGIAKEEMSHAAEPLHNAVMERQPQQRPSGDGPHSNPDTAHLDPVTSPLAAVAFSRDDFQDRREKYVHELTDRALDQLAADLDAGRSDALVTYLQTMSRFHHYSLGNQILIALQRPDATHVAGFHAWKKFDRLVNKGERGIVILAPVTKIVGSEREVRADGSVEDVALRRIVNTRPVHVFDVSQTHGEPLPEFPRYQGDPGGYFDRLTLLFEEHSITLNYPDHIPGGAMGVSRKGAVEILAGLDPAESFHVHVHELAHELLHRGEEQRKHSTLTSRETEAEAVAYVVCSGVGLDCSTAASDYIQLYRGNRDALVESLHAIRIAGAAILGSLLSPGNNQPSIHRGPTQLRPHKT